MSETIVRDLREMTDSREMLQAKPHPFIAVFISLLLMILAGALIWSYVSEMDIVVKAAGVVRPNERIGVVRNIVAGRVAEIHYEAGQRVRQDDLLYALENEARVTELKMVREEMSKLSAELERLQALRASLASDNPDAAGMTSGLQTDLTSEFSVEKSLRIRLAEVESRLGRAKAELSDLRLLERSVTEGRNLFQHDNMEYYSRYQDYAYKREKLDLQLQKAFDQYRQSARLSDDEKATAQRVVHEAKLALEEFENEFLLSIRAGIAEQSRVAQELEFERSRLYAELGTAIEEAERRMLELERRLQAAELEVSYLEVRAPKDGIVHATAQLGVGEWVQSGQEVLTIVPDGDEEFVIELSFPNKDIADVRVGDRIRYHFHALPYKEYGELEGRLTLIGADATVSPDGTGSYYSARATIENRPLFNHKGEEARIKVGMLCEAYIVTDSKKILYYLLEKLDFMD